MSMIDYLLVCVQSNIATDKQMTQHGLDIPSYVEPDLSTSSTR